MSAALKPTSTQTDVPPKTDTKGNEPPATSAKTDSTEGSVKKDASARKAKSKPRRTKEEEINDLRKYMAASRAAVPYDENDEDKPAVVPKKTKKRVRPAAEGKASSSSSSSESKSTSKGAESKSSSSKRGRPKRAAGATAVKRVKSERKPIVELSEREKWSLFMTGKANKDDK